jgi:xanthine/uracil permease
MRLALRLVAAIIGVVGAIVAFIVNTFYSGVNDLMRVAGDPHRQTHGFIGLLLVVVGLIGAFVGIPSPITGSILMLVAALGFIYVVHWWALVASPLLLLAAVLAYMDRKKEPAKSE